MATIIYKTSREINPLTKTYQDEIQILDDNGRNASRTGLPQLLSIEISSIRISHKTLMDSNRRIENIQTTVEVYN